MPREIAKKPDKCAICGGTEFWLRTAWGPPAWLCSRCKPKPGEKKEKENLL